jgi:hypothetical protein
MCAKHNSFKTCLHHQPELSAGQQRQQQHVHGWWGCALSAQDVLCSFIILITFALFLSMQIPEYCSSLPWPYKPSVTTSSAAEPAADNQEAEQATVMMNLFSKQHLNWMDRFVCPRHNMAATAAAAACASPDTGMINSNRSSKSKSSGSGRFALNNLPAVLVMLPGLCHPATAAMQAVAGRVLQVILKSHHCLCIFGHSFTWPLTLAS